VDLNVDGHLAVTSTGAFIGNADYLTHKRREYKKWRGQMQQTGTRSAHLTMTSLGGRFANWSEDYLHRVSKALVQEALAHDTTHIAFEKLKHIRDRISNASKFQQWAFRRIQEYTEYKAAEHGIEVEKHCTQVTPELTQVWCWRDNQSSCPRVGDVEREQH
jgi:IS605 OrfB family transposase